MPDERVSVLVVAGDTALSQTIRATLSTTGFILEEAFSGPDAVGKVLRSSYNLVLIGIGEKNCDGFDICRQLRAVSPNLGIVLFRSGGSVQVDIRALEAGADDCVSAPFRFRELVGRLGAVLRRPFVDIATGGNVLRAGDVKIDIARRVCWRARNKIHLSPREFDLLAALMKHQERPLTHVKLLVAVWGPEAGHDADYLRSYIKALRRKIEIDPARPEYIVTVPWVGYMFCDPGRRTIRQPTAWIE
jgi:two-component system KDP operon response regulator KdpE